ncbi:pelota family protein, partial [Acidianus sp. RZ1]|uniref:pelota family protein n=1 Tax=Acidianus sp. RZ1 TaxID=1540082 RepID=UPI0014917082
MKVLEFDEKKGILRLYLEDEDDLWTLQTILKKGDKVIARTSRDVGLGNESRRISMVIELIVEYTEFQSFTTRLRIHGVVTDAPEKYSLKGSHHTINLDVGNEILVIKEKWTKQALQRIYKQAEKRSKILVALVDFDEYIIAIPMNQGIRILSESTLESLSKNSEGVIEDNANKIAKEIESYFNEYKPDAVIVAGPGPFKDIVKSKLQGMRVYTDSVSSATRSGLNEILRRDIIDQVMRDYEISKGIRKLEDALANMSKDTGLVTYGLEEIEKAAELGAVETLLVIE